MNLIAHSKLLSRNVRRQLSCRCNLISKRFLTASQLKEYQNILKLGRSATSKDVRNSFLRLSKIHHPDNAATGNHGEFVKLKEAYDALKDGMPRGSASFTSPDEARNYNNNNYYDSDLSHKAYARYRDIYRDRYSASEEQKERYGFGGPFAQSSSPWEDLQRVRRARRESEYRDSFGVRAAGRPLVHLTIFLSAIAWIFLYSGAILIWDYNDQLKKGMSRFHSRNYEEYIAYQKYLKEKESKRLRMGAERPASSATAAAQPTAASTTEPAGSEPSTAPGQASEAHS